MSLIVHIKVADTDLSIMRGSGFILCFNRDVKYGAQEKKGNVVFSMVKPDKLSPTMDLSWEDSYEVYETTTFQAGAKAGVNANVGTEIVPIEGGLCVNFDANGKATITGSVDSSQPFTVRNEWKHPASIGIKNYDITTGTFASIFVSPPVPVNSTSKLLPIKKFSVFWDMLLTTNTMFLQTGTDPYPFNLIDNNEITLQYKDGSWKKI